MPELTSQAERDAGLADLEDLVRRGVITDPAERSMIFHKTCLAQRWQDSPGISALTFAVRRDDRWVVIAEMDCSGVTTESAPRRLRQYADEVEAAWRKRKGE